MTTEEISLLDHLKNLGFDVKESKILGNNQILIVEKIKDPWGGCEFAECLEKTTFLDDSRIYPIKQEAGDNIKITRPACNIITSKKHFKPSNQESYEEQLKKDAYEKFGEIKEGDRFVFIDEVQRYYSTLGNIEWDYCKSEDQLFHYNICLYQQGKWAQKIEKVEVEYCDWNYDHRSDKRVLFHFRLNGWESVKNKNNIGELLAQYLEEHLNNQKP